MARRIKVTDKKARTIRSTSQQVSSIDPKQIEHGLGAEKTDSTVALKGSPYALTALRQELAERLCSTGGRRSLEGTVRRQKIPMTEEDWERLKQRAELQKKDKTRPTPGQIAGVLLHQALEEFEEDIASGNV